MKKSLIVIGTVCAVLGLAGPASAGSIDKPGWTNYAGKTKEGGPISFVYRKGRVAFLEARIHTTCGTTQGGNPVPKGFFDPPGNVEFRVNGKESQFKMNDWPTRFYTFKGTKRGKRIVGNLRLSWLLPLANYTQSRVCLGTARFNLKPSRKK